MMSIRLFCNFTYEIIIRHMVNNGFSWLQGSVYVSNQPMTTTEITHILDELVVKNPWLNICMRDCRETNIDKEHDKSHVFDKNAHIPTGEELKYFGKISQILFPLQNINTLHIRPESRRHRILFFKIRCFCK